MQPLRSIGDSFKEKGAFDVAATTAAAAAAATAGLSRVLGPLRRAV